MPSAIILDMEFDVVINDFTPYDPGVFTGPAEDCYPPEGGEVDWNVDPDFEGCEFIEAALEKNSDWCEDVEQQLYLELSER